MSKDFGAFGSVDVDFRRHESDLIYFCGDDYYGYYSLEEFKHIVWELNQILKKVEAFINEHK